MQHIKSLQSRRVETRGHHLLHFLHRRAYLALSRKPESALIPKQNGHSTERAAVSNGNRELGKSGHFNTDRHCVWSCFPSWSEWLNFLKDIGKDPPGEIRSLNRCIAYPCNYSLFLLKCFHLPSWGWCLCLTPGLWGQAMPGVPKSDPHWAEHGTRSTELRTEQCTDTLCTLLVSQAGGKAREVEMLHTKADRPIMWMLH